MEEPIRRKRERDTRVERRLKERKVRKIGNEERKKKEERKK